MTAGRLSPLSLLWRGLRFHWRSHLAVLAGAAVAAAILTGALLVGDSVRYTLQRLVDLRLGSTDVVIHSPDRFFRSALASEVADEAGAQAAAAILVEGVAISGDSRLRANRVQVVGVDESFWQIFGASEGLSADEGAVNRRLANQLDLEAGDDLVLRLARGDSPPGELSLSSSDRNTALRLKVGEIVGDDRGGRFSLRAEQVSPLTVFVPLELLASTLGVEDRANLMLVAETDVEKLSAALASTWQLADAGLTLRAIDAGGFELVSDQVLIQDVIVAAADAVDSPAKHVFTYLVNGIAGAESTTPYSFVAGLDGVPPSPIARDDQIVVNQWLADDIGVTAGDNLTVTYFTPTSEGGLVEESAVFEVSAVVPIEGAAADEGLAPLVPGLSDAESCRDWDPGIPIDLDRIRDHDEHYWDRYQGTPKAFITLGAAERLWSNRYGAATAVRFPAWKGDEQTLATALLDQLDPAAVGLSFVAARETGLNAGGGGVDFGQLFLSLSFFIIAAALLLVGLLFSLSVRQRATDAGVLGAIGLGRRQVMWLVAGEGLIVAALGSGLGALLGLLYNQVVLSLLGSVWRGAVGVSGLSSHVEPATVFTGWLISTSIAAAVVLVVARAQARRPPLDLLGRADTTPEPAGRSAWLSLIAAAVCLVAAVVIVLAVGPDRGKEAAGAFWGAGFLMLATLLSGGRGLLLRHQLRASSGAPTLLSLGIANASRKRGRTMVAATLLATGVFIVVAVGANRHGQQGTELRSSGTGGFAFYAQTTLPLFSDLADPLVRSRLGLDDLADEDVVRLRLREGDDASCLNLNRVASPPLLGVDPSAFSSRSAFTFVALRDGADPDDPWSVLDQPLADGAIPAVADQSVIQWGLGLKIGDEIRVQDDAGREVVVRLVGGLANSVFQGRLLISEAAFITAFPHETGHRVLLVDATPASRDDVSLALTRALRDQGLELQLAAARLAEFSVVETTYLSVFLALGGLGLLIGTLGLGVIVLRDVAEQRGTLAVMRAVGLSRREVQRTLVAELAVILGLGLVGGIVAALVAVLPALRSPGTEIPFVFLGVTVAAITASGVVSTLVASRLATAGDPLPALRLE